MYASYSSLFNLRPACRSTKLELTPPPTSTPIMILLATRPLTLRLRLLGISLVRQFFVPHLRPNSRIKSAGGGGNGGKGLGLGVGVLGVAGGQGVGGAGGSGGIVNIS